MKLKILLTLCASSLLTQAVHAELLLIDNATVYTPSAVLENADVLIDGNKIIKVAQQIEPPAGAKVIDAKGGAVTPTLFNAYTHLGVSEVDQIATTVDVYSENTEVTAAIKIADAFNPESVMLPHNQINGLGHAVVMPESAASIFSGQAALVQLSNTAVVVNDSIGVVVQLGEYGQELAGGSRATALALLRVALDEAKDYSVNRAAAHRGASRQYSHSYADLAALKAVVEGDKPLIVKVSRAADITQVIKLAKQYQLKVILSGVQEGWKVANQIAAAKMPVIIDPIHNLPVAYESLASRLDNAVILHQAGVKLLFTGMSWHNTHNAYLVRQSTGNAVANGLPKQVALAAITSNPAEVFGLPNAGSIKEGSIANLVLWSGDPFEVTSYPSLVMLEGEASKGVSRQLRLRDRYFAKLKQAANTPN